MTVVAEFRIPAELFAFEQTLAESPSAVIEIERVAAAKEVLTPYFWVTECELDAFDAVAREDPSVTNLERLDVFEQAALYRADWADRTDAVAFAYTDAGAVIVEATGQHGAWELRMRFDDRESLHVFRDYCGRNGIDFTLMRLYDPDADHVGARHGLTEKQADALTTAWNLGYFETPRRATLADVGEALGVSSQSVSQRLRRAHQTWVETALTVTPPDHEPEARI